MTFSGNGPRNSSLHFSGVPDSRRRLTFDLPEIIGRDQRPKGFIKQPTML